jgi:hypothetical protein
MSSISLPPSPRKIVYFLDNVEKYCTAGQATDSNITRRLRIACWITKAINTHPQYVILIAFSRQKMVLRTRYILLHCLFCCVASERLFYVTIGWISFTLCIACKIDFFLFGTKNGVGATQPPLHWVRMVLSEKVKRPLSSAKFQEYVNLYFRYSYKPSYCEHGNIYLHIFSVQWKSKLVFVLNSANTITSTSEVVCSSTYPQCHAGWISEVNFTRLHFSPWDVPSTSAVQVVWYIVK